VGTQTLRVNSAPRVLVVEPEIQLIDSFEDVLFSLDHPFEHVINLEEAHSRGGLCGPAAAGDGKPLDRSVFGTPHVVVKAEKHLAILDILGLSSL
jgi:hypothetical protein